MSTQIINGIFYDGDYTVPIPVDGVETSNPFPFQPTTQIFEQKFQQFYVDPNSGAPLFVPLPISSSPAVGGMDPAVTFDGNTKTGRGPWLVEETKRQDVGAGIREWSRIWAQVPYPIFEFPAMSYSRQKYCVSTVPWGVTTDVFGNQQGTWRTFAGVEEWSEPLTGIVHRQFLRIDGTKTPAKMLARAQPVIPFRIIKVTDERSKEYIFKIGTEGVAEPTQPTRWMGEIWEIRNVYVAPANLGTILSGGGFFNNIPASLTAQAAYGNWTPFTGGLQFGGGM